MNVMGELASLVGLSALAGVIIGWCIRNFFGGSDKKVRQHYARDMDEAAKDAKHLRRALDSKDNELQDTKATLRNLRFKDGSTESDTRVQVKEINELKQELATAKKTLLDNQSEFNTYRTEAKKDQTRLRSELSKYTAGGSASTERLNEATETVSALRSAVRENDKVIDSLRARVKEADTTVENLRSQLTTSESGRNQIENASLEYDKKVEVLTKKVEDTTATVEKQKRDYDLMLENKNTDIKNLHSKVEELTTSSSALKTREQDFDKQTAQYKEAENKFKTEIVDLKRVISDRDQALSKARQQTTELNSQIKSARQHEEQEVQRLKARLNSTSESRIKSKSAEVSALNEMLTESANKRDTLQKKLNEKEQGFVKLSAELNDVSANRDKLRAELEDVSTSRDKLRTELKDVSANRDELRTEIDDAAVSRNKLRAEIDDIAASRNKVSTQLGELQTQGNVALEKLQQDMNSLANTRDEYKSVIGSLQSQISELTKSKESQLQDLRNELTSASDANESKYKQTTTDLTNQKNSLQNDLKTLNAKLHDQTRSIEQHKTDLSKQIEINQRISSKLEEKEGKLTEFRSKLNFEESESQRLNRELSAAEALRLTLTERDAELRKTQIELQEAAVTGGPVQKLLEEQQKQNDTLTRALQDRDDELARLNTQITNNRLRSKQQQSSIAMLTDEKNAQSALVSSLEQQAENTLQLHTKIAQQSTELEDLRARLHERDNSIRPSTQVTTNASYTSGTTHSTTATSGLQQVETRQSADTKPRVFVRSDADTEALTGATGYHSSQRAQYTSDGHRIHRPDGSDDLTLLPGVTQTIAGALNRNGITTFDQISNWGEREVTHYAERIGVSVQRARKYQWSKASTSILNGTYRKDGQEIGN